MISVSPKHRIFLCIAPIDFRKGLNSIARLCLCQLRQDPLQGHYFIFRNRRKTDIKLLYYDAQGFCLFQKRLSTGRFEHWPTADNPLVSLTPTQLHVLLSNGNPGAVHEMAAWHSVVNDNRLT